MFTNVFQNGIFFEIFNEQSKIYFYFYSKQLFLSIDKELVKQWKFIGKNAKIYDNELRSYIHILNVGALSKMQIPTNEKTSLNLMHGYLTFQIFLNTTKSFTIEIAISDTNNGKKRILLSACSKEFVKNQLHCRIPIINIPTGIWINFSVDILSFVGECFKGQSFRAIDSICLSADCKIRRICGMRQLYTLSLEEYLQGNDTILPKGFILPSDIKYTNINFDMNYIKQTVEIKNIKNNEHIYPKTSQSKRDVKITNNINQNQGNDANNKYNNGNKIIRNNKKSKSINKHIIKNNLEKDLTKSKNKYNLKDFTETSKGSTKNLKKIEKNNLIKTSKPEKKYKNNFIKTKSKEKLNSKSVGKVYIKSKTTTFTNNKNAKKALNNNEINNKEQKNININNNIQKEKKIKDKKNKESNLNINNNNKLSSQNNKNTKNKEELNLFNTFNYKDLESKENTLYVNQSNFNNASIPEIVDLETNNYTYLKNLENDINSNNNDIILLDKNNKKDDDNIFNIQEQMDSLIVEKMISDINDNNNERPYTPPLQKIIPVGNENNITLNNTNISKINESLIQNHYCDLVYDKETGRYYDKKTKIFYDFK